MKEEAEIINQNQQSTLTLADEKLNSGHFEEAVKIVYGEISEEMRTCKRGNQPLVDKFLKFAPELKCECGDILRPRFTDRLKVVYDECEPCAVKKYRGVVLCKIDETMQRMGAAKRHLTARMEDFKNVKVAANESLFLYGPCGTGKTYLLTAIMRKIILDTPPTNLYGSYSERISYAEPHLNGFPHMVTIPELLLKIRSAFKSDSEISEEFLIEEYATRKVLMLDDIGSEKPTEWAMQTLYLLIDRRYREMKQTFFTSNLSLDQLSERFSDRIASRIAGMCRVIKMIGKDKRI